MVRTTAPSASITGKMHEATALPVHDERACAAFPHAAGLFGPGKPEDLPDKVKERPGRIYLGLDPFLRSVERISLFLIDMHPPLRSRRRCSLARHVIASLFGRTLTISVLNQSFSPHGVPRPCLRWPRLRPASVRAILRESISCP